MNAAQIHLGLNHVPIGLVLVGVPLLAVALWRKSSELRITAAALLILAALASIPTFLSGEPAEEIIEHRAGVSEAVIHEHEEAGEFAFILISVLGGVVLLGLAFEKLKGPLPAGAWWGVVLLGILSLGVFFRTAHLGGLIRHDELGRESSAPPAPELDDD